MRIYPNVSVTCAGKVSDNFVNDVTGWNFPKAYLEANEGELLTLDIDFGEHCSLSCPHCFRRDGRVQATKNRALSYKETMHIIKEAKKLGLETIKILGAGEPFENKKFLQFLGAMKELGIQVNVFTKAHVFGDEDLAKRYYDMSCLELAQEIKRLGVSLNVGLHSFEPKIQDERTGTPGYTIKRNRALELLAQVGLNEGQPTKLSLAIVPITNQNVDEVFDIYKWARERNMYPIATVSMCAGRAEDSWKHICPSPERLIELYTQINIYNVKKVIATLKEIQEDGISAYAGGCVCQQVSCGMYITSRGVVLRCPGDDVTVFGNVREKTLAEIWHGSENYQRSRRKTYNCGCPPKDGKSIQCGFYQAVQERVLAHFMKEVN